MHNVENIVSSTGQAVQAGSIAQVVCEAMLSRLQWMVAEPKVIVEIGGGGGGASSVAWKNYYPEASVFTADSLPLHDHSVDLIFANLFLPWQPDMQTVLQTWRRCLSPNGLLMLSTLGWDTLCECHPFIDAAHRPVLVDMHDVGDALVQQGLIDPVLDVERITVTYRHPERLIDELLGGGFWFPPPLAEGDIERLLAQWPLAGDTRILTYEVIYAHAFAPTITESTSQHTGIAKIPLSQVKRALKQT